MCLSAFETASYAAKDNLGFLMFLVAFEESQNAGGLYLSPALCDDRDVNPQLSTYQPRTLPNELQFQFQMLGLSLLVPGLFLDNNGMVWTPCSMHSTLDIHTK